MWDDGIVGEVRGLASSPPEVLVTSGLDAHPDHRIAFPTPTIWPLIAAIATTVLFIGSIFTPWAVVWGSIPVAIAMIAWFWPSHAETRRHRALEKPPFADIAKARGEESAA